jgi:2'-5' RNA ligase
MNSETVSNRPMASVQTDMYEYLLVAHPDAPVQEKLVEENHFFSTQFNARVAIKTKPHITVANFLATEQMEETIIRWMHRVISTNNSFNVTIDEYGAFRPHTIYLKIRDHQPFKQLATGLKVIDQYIQSYGCPKMKLVDNAHLTIARRLDALTYEQAVKLYAEKTFHASFDVKELVLLRRRDQFDSCRQVNVFRLL